MILFEDRFSPQGSTQFIRTHSALALAKRWLLAIVLRNHLTLPVSCFPSVDTLLLKFRWTEKEEVEEEEGLCFHEPASVQRRSEHRRLQLIVATTP